MKQVNQGSNQYCGPAVLSILTGLDTDKTAQLIKSVDSNYNGSYVYMPSLLLALRRGGFDANVVEKDCSLFRLFHSIASKDGQYIVVVPSHVVAVEVTQGKVYLCDNHTKEPINGAASSRLGQRVLECYKVEPRPQPKLLREYVSSTQGNGKVYFEYRTEYDDTEYDTIESLGYIVTKDREQVKAIAMKLLLD